MIIKECFTDSDVKSTFTVMKQLRPNLSTEDDYLHIFKNLNLKFKYRLVGIFNNDRCLAVLGFRVTSSFFSLGRAEIYIDELVVDSEYRNQGFGKMLFNWVKIEGKKLGYKSIILDAATHRSEAHKFYQREDMKITAFHFRRPLSPDISKIEESENVVVKAKL